jgi:hypothetical protein
MPDNWRSMIMTVTNGSKEEIVHYQTDTKNIVDWRESYKNELNEYIGKPNGVASLDNNGYVPKPQLYYAMKGITDLQTQLPQAIATATENLVKTVAGDGNGVITVTKANGTQNTINKIANSISADTSVAASRLILRKIHNVTELNFLEDNVHFYGEFDLPGIPETGHDWTGWQTGTEGVTGEIGQKDQFICIGDNVDIYHRRLDNDHDGWSIWFKLQNQTGWSKLNWTGQHNTTDTWIPVFRDNNVDYVLKQEIAASGFTDCSLAERGYQRLPSGLLFQWGKDNLGNNDREELSSWFTFPKRFNSACFHVYLTDLNHDENKSDAHDNVIQIWDKNQDGFNVYKQMPSGKSASWFSDFCWLAIGV